MNQLRKHALGVIWWLYYHPLQLRLAFVTWLKCWRQSTSPNGMLESTQWIPISISDAADVTPETKSMAIFRVKAFYKNSYIFSSCIMHVVYLLLFFVILTNVSCGQHLTDSSLSIYIIVGHMSIYLYVERGIFTKRNISYQISWTCIYFHVCFEISKRETIYIHLAHIYIYGGRYRSSLRISIRII